MAKIVHVTSVHWVFDIRIFQKQCRSLAAAGHEVSLVGPYQQEEERDGVRILPIAAGNDRWSRITGTSRKAIARAMAEPADLYHLHDPELLLWARSLRKKNVPVVYDMHEDLPRQIRTKSWLPKLIRRPLSMATAIFEKNTLHGMPVVMAELSYKDHRPWLGKSADVLNFPRLEWVADIPVFEPQSLEPKLGYLGTVTKNRGCLVTLEAMRILAERGVATSFDCVGPIADELREEMESEAHHKGLSNALYVAGRLPAKAAWTRMAECRIGLALLEPIPNYITSFPTKMFEYMAMGIPVIVSDFPLYREIIEKCGCGLVVDPMNPEAIADAIAGLLSDPDLCAEMGHRGVEAARDSYSWSSEEKKLLEFYDSLLGDSNVTDASG